MKRSLWLLTYSLYSLYFMDLLLLPFCTSSQQNSNDSMILILQTGLLFSACDMAHSIPSSIMPTPKYKFLFYFIIINIFPLLCSRHCSKCFMFVKSLILKETDEIVTITTLILWMWKLRHSEKSQLVVTQLGSGYLSPFVLLQTIKQTNKKQKKKKHNTLSEWLKQHLFHTVLEAGKFKISPDRFGVWQDQFLVHKWPSSCCALTWEKGHVSSLGFLLKGH